jgi:hypothetical protein
MLDYFPPSILRDRSNSIFILTIKIKKMKSVFFSIICIGILSLCIKKDTLKINPQKIYYNERPARIAQIGFCRLIKKTNGSQKEMLVVNHTNDTLRIRWVSDFVFLNSNYGDSVFVKFNRDSKGFEVE